MFYVNKPTPITPAMLVSSVVTEADHAAYSSGTTYALADLAMYNHRNYESLQAGNVGHTPDEINSTWWLDLGPTNKWAMFDSVVSTATTLTTSVGVPALTVVVSPGICNSVSVLDITGAASVRVQMHNGATLVFDKTKTMDATYISDWYQYFFEPYQVASDVLFGPLPPYPGAQITVTITPTTVGSVVTCGALLFGNTVDLGDTQYGASAGVNDYSVFETDSYGVTTLVRRGYAKKSSYSLMVKNTQLRRVFSTLAALRATPAVWVGTDDVSLSPLTVFGVVKSWGINVTYSSLSSVSIEIQGLL